MAELLALADKFFGGIAEIDFFSLDVEGAELKVLQTFNWSIPVKLFMVELADGSPDPMEIYKRQQIRELMDMHGYVEMTQSIFPDKSGNALFTSRELNRTLHARREHCSIPLRHAQSCRDHEDDLLPTRTAAVPAPGAPAPRAARVRT